MRLILFSLAAIAFAAALGLATAAPGRAHPGPHGVLSLDHTAADNTATGVGTIQACASKSLSTGQQFTVDLVIQDIPGAGEDMGAFQARIKFNPAIIRFVSLQVSDPAPGAQFFMEKSGSVQVSPLTSENGPGDWTVGGFQFGTQRGNNGAGLLARLTFSVVASGLTDISIDTARHSFYTDVSFTNHDYSTVNSGSVGINRSCDGGTDSGTSPGGTGGTGSTSDDISGGTGDTSAGAAGGTSADDSQDSDPAAGQEAVQSDEQDGTEPVEEEAGLGTVTGPEAEDDPAAGSEEEDEAAALEAQATDSDGGGGTNWPLIAGGTAAGVVALAGAAWLLRRRFA